MNLKERAKQLMVDIPAVYLALKDKETPLLAKLLAGIVVVYALSPIDLIPDFIPVIGYLDDVLLLPCLITLTIKLIPDEVFDRCREESKGLWAEGRPKGWLYALPIVVIWIVLIVGVIKVIKG
ncbi:MAG: DUF1232 domain-containing protein [Erysipelotrichaceae bacterium]|nr:DUF1232 domain-containing protein [Erysipelotrichaceae bacterium]